jgi:hypothetical protein
MGSFEGRDGELQVEAVPNRTRFDMLIESLSPQDYAAKEKRLVRKIDIRLMPMLILMIVLKYVTNSKETYIVRLS